MRQSSGIAALAQQLGEQLRDREGVKPMIFRLDETENGGGNP